MQAEDSKVTNIATAKEPEPVSTPGQLAAFEELNSLRQEFINSGANAPDHVILIFKKPDGGIGFYTNDASLIEKAGMMNIVNNIVNGLSIKKG